MREAKHISGPTPYATCADFRRIFDEDMNRLYLLSFLLTADPDKAEQCFVCGLEDAADGNPVFKEWARSWARRAILQNAVRVVNPRPGKGFDRLSSASIHSDDKVPLTEPEAEVAAVLRLDPFERFVYVMRLLEHYSDHECSILLGCARRGVLTARTRALQNLGSAMDLHYQQLPNAGSQHSASHERHSSVLELMVAQRLVTSA